MRENTQAANEPITQSKTKKQVKEALMADERTRDYSIDVVDNNGVITLKGEVESIEIRQAAEQIAARPQTVIRVINDLTISSGSEKATSDPELAVQDLPGTTPKTRNSEFAVKDLPGSGGETTDPEYTVKDLPDDS